MNLKKIKLLFKILFKRKFNLLIGFDLNEGKLETTYIYSFPKKIDSKKINIIVKNTIQEINKELKKEEL